MYVITMLKDVNLPGFDKPEPMTIRAVMGCREWVENLYPALLKMGYNISIVETETMPERSDWEVKQAERILNNAYAIYDLI